MWKCSSNINTVFNRKYAAHNILKINIIWERFCVLNLHKKKNAVFYTEKKKIVVPWHYIPLVVVLGYDNPLKIAKKEKKKRKKERKGKTTNAY